ncbi:MAG: HAD family hydrolase [Candidatus Riflebacteria bacterium]|nr:HAD family hydrolase [Candidatus Riflebacteria bacterium]
MNTDAIIFDIDGTLWNACSASAKGWNAGLASLGIDIQITTEQIESVAGNPYEKCVEILLPGLLAQYPTLLDTFNNYEFEAVVRSAGGTFYDGVIEGVNSLAGSHKIFLVSNCQDWYMKLFLQSSGLDSVLTGFDCHGMSGKPKSEMLSRIKNDYCLKAPIYVGDTAGDETAASLAGIDFIHVSYGFGSPSSNAVSLRSFAALLDYLNQL